MFPVDKLISLLHLLCWNELLVDLFSPREWELLNGHVKLWYKRKTVPKKDNNVNEFSVISQQHTHKLTSGDC